MTNVDLSPIRFGRRALVGLLTAALPLAAAASVATNPAAAALKYKQPACGKFQKQVRNSTGAKKRTAKAQLKQCQSNATVYKQVRDSHFVGTRADGVEIDTLYCANGKWQDDVEAGGDVGASGWRIVDAKVSKDGRNFTAVVEAWQVGYEFSGKINSPGPVEKRDARATCASL